jgi:hypothetical protein
MRFALLFLLLLLPASAAVPPLLREALDAFRADPPPGWSYAQKTSGDGRSTVELCDAAKPEFDRWSLVEKDGRAPTAAEIRDYTEARSRRSRTGTAPKITDQLDLDLVETVAETADRATFRTRLRRGEARDHTAPFLRATVVVHKPTRAIESIELGNTEPFSPTLGVRIAEMRTVLTYRLPVGDTPALPASVASRVRGSAFWFKSLDADLTVEFSGYARAAKR